MVGEYHHKRMVRKVLARASGAVEQHCTPVGDAQDMPILDTTVMTSHELPDELPHELPRGPRGCALVTGASHRVGRAIAIELAQAGFGLVLTYRTRSSACRETARFCVEAAHARGHQIDASVAALDLSDAVGTERFGRELAARSRASRPIDLVVHNASMYQSAAFGSITLEEFERTQRVEIVSPLLLTQSLREALEASQLAGGASVVFFSDIHALERARPGFTPYLISKSGVATLARQLAVELAPRVRVHCIAPGVILWPDDFPDAAKEAILARTPLGRAGTAEDAAKLVRFLALEAPSMTGETIYLDGGRALR